MISVVLVRRASAPDLRTAQPMKVPVWPHRNHDRVIVGQLALDLVEAIGVNDAPVRNLESGRLPSDPDVRTPAYELVVRVVGISHNSRLEEIEGGGNLRAGITAHAGLSDGVVDIGRTGDPIHFKPGPAFQKTHVVGPRRVTDRPSDAGALLSLIPGARKPMAEIGLRGKMRPKERGSGLARKLFLRFEHRPGGVHDIVRVKPVLGPHLLQWRREEQNDCHGRQKACLHEHPLERVAARTSRSGSEDRVAGTPATLACLQAWRTTTTTSASASCSPSSRRRFLQAKDKCGHQDLRSDAARRCGHGQLAGTTGPPPAERLAATTALGEMLTALARRVSSVTRRTGSSSGCGTSTGSPAATPL